MLNDKDGKFLHLTEIDGAIHMTRGLVTAEVPNKDNEIATTRPPRRRTSSGAVNSLPQRRRPGVASLGNTNLLHGPTAAAKGQIERQGNGTHTRLLANRTTPCRHHKTPRALGRSNRDRTGHDDSPQIAAKRRVPNERSN